MENWFVNLIRDCPEFHCCFVVDKDIEIELFVMTEFVDDDTWGDLTPIPQDEGPDPVVQIAYSDECEIIIPRQSVLTLFTNLVVI